MSSPVPLRLRARLWSAFLLACAGAWIGGVPWAHAQPGEAAEPPGSVPPRAASWATGAFVAARAGYGGGDDSPSQTFYGPMVGGELGWLSPWRRTYAGLAFSFGFGDVFDPISSGCGHKSESMAFSLRVGTHIEPSSRLVIRIAPTFGVRRQKARSYCHVRPMGSDRVVLQWDEEVDSFVEVGATFEVGVRLVRGLQLTVGFDPMIAIGRGYDDSSSGSAWSPAASVSVGLAVALGGDRALRVRGARRVEARGAPRTRLAPDQPGCRQANRCARRSSAR